ncbi:N-formylglutamate amidohydrolase [Pikeienuella piscinae]|uniref:N-formylglutamate amidohydrolase n=2 Tax=Pikeienuella piscinae TaxID=2748098 RepID=A0A7M3T775_9RHOB|nr:N-formylglutamate amidohydrolase [Pikeienuella piscinae]
MSEISTSDDATGRAGVRPGATSRRLLGVGDPAPVEQINGDGAAGLVLLCEHAGRAVPARLSDLALPSAEMDKHIAWDIGAEAVARLLSQHLDAPLILQRYSRLVIDANRPLSASDCIPEISDGVAIPGNRQLSEADRRLRYDEIHAPYHAAVSALLDSRARASRPTLLVTVHSFTPVMAGASRDMAVGLLFNRDRRLAVALMDMLARIVPDEIVALNAPYSVDDESDYSIPVHGESRGLPHVLIELRNDLVADAAGQGLWAGRLADALRRILDEPEFAS